MIYKDFQNLKKINKTTHKIEDYLFYLERFANFEEIPVFCKDANYDAYLEKLQSYIMNFYKKTHPLENTDQYFQSLEIEFEDAFKSANSDKLPGWRAELKIVRGEECNQLFYCVPCKQAYMNENSFIYHKKGKKHISAVNRIKGAAPTIDLIDKEML